MPDFTTEFLRFSYSISSISSGQSLPQVQGQSMQQPIATNPRMVKRMKWLRLALVKAPIMMGESVEAAVPKIDSTPPEMLRTLIGNSSVEQMPQSANSMDMANRKTKTRASCMKTVAHISQLSGLVMKMRTMEAAVATMKRMEAHFLLRTLSMMSIRGQQVSRSDTFSTVSEVQMLKPNWPTISVGPQYIMKVAMLMNPCAMVIVRNELQRKTSQGTEGLSYLIVSCTLITFWMSAIVRMSFCCLLISPISLISLSAFSGSFLMRYMGDSLRKQVMTSALITAGIVRQQIEVIFQSSQRQQKSVTSSAPTVNAPCTIEVTFCLKLSLRHSAAVEPKVTNTESEPNPQRTNPNEAIHSPCAKTSSKQPATVIHEEMTSVILLPVLSARMAMKKQPIIVPRQGALEQRLRQTSSEQQQVPNSLASERNLAASGVMNLLHWSLGRLQTASQQLSVSSPEALQSNSGLLKMKEVLISDIPVTQKASACIQAKMYWKRPLPPTFSINCKQVQGSRS